MSVEGRCCTLRRRRNRFCQRQDHIARLGANWASEGRLGYVTSIFGLAREALSAQFAHGNLWIEMASNYAAELQRPTLGLTERRGVGGGLPRSSVRYFP